MTSTSFTSDWLRRTAAVLVVLGLISCSSAPKTEPELSEMEGKKVALIEIDGESSAKAVVEVALVNQLVKNGSFFLLSEKQVQAARNAPDQSPTDLNGIARRAGADYALRAKILEFAADQTESYAAVEEEDSQLEAERGDGKTERIIKIHTLAGSVRVQLDFTDVSGDEKDATTRTGVAEEKKTLTENSKKGAIHLPPKLRFLEELTNEAFRKFFERYK